MVISKLHHNKKYDYFRKKILYFTKGKSKFILFFVPKYQYISVNQWEEYYKIMRAIYMVMGF